LVVLPGFYRGMRWYAPIYKVISGIARYASIYAIALIYTALYIYSTALHRYCMLFLLLAVNILNKAFGYMRFFIYLYRFI
jgi:hypothetical protein